MIVVNRLTGGEFGLNPDLIERIDASPDTIVTLIDGTKYIVAESVGEIVQRVTLFRAQVLATARTLQADAADAGAGDDDQDPSDGAPLAPAVPLRPRNR
jgi:flagellar protein FlbD